MKILKYFLILLVVVLIGGFTYVSFQPSDYNVSRSKVIKAPVTTVFGVVSDLESWEKWGPWHDEDTTIVVTYGDKTVGLGASSTWTSKDGPGNMEMVVVEPNQAIDLKLQFEDYDPSDLQWRFKEVEGGTEVTWTMKEEGAPFMFKMVAAFVGGWDSMFGPMQEAGLDNLDKVIMEEVKLANSFRVGEVKAIDLEKKKFIGYYIETTTDASHEEMTKLFTEFMPKAGIHAAQSGLQPGEYVPGSVYTKWDEETKEAQFYIGLLLHKDIKPAKGMKVVTLPKGKGVMVRKHGNYGTGDMEAHAEIAKFLEANKLQPQDLVWELYTNDPVDVKPQDIQTDIYYAVK